MGGHVADKSYGGATTRRRMNQDRSSVFAILAVVAALLLLQVVLWRFVCAISRFGPWLQRYAAGCRLWARATSLRRALKTVYPRAYALFASRFVPAPFTGLSLTLTCLGAFYAGALLGGLIDDLRETEGLVGQDYGVNAFFALYRTPSLIEAFVWITALGAGPAIAGMVAVASALLWSQGRTRLLLSPWITFLGAQGTTFGTPGRGMCLGASSLDCWHRAWIRSWPPPRRSGCTAAASFGPGLIAEDLPDLLPGVLRGVFARAATLA
jgi:hypothetical protein